MTSAWGTSGGLMMRGVNWAVTRAAPDASRGRRGRGLSGLPGLCIRCRVPIPASSCATARGGHFLGTGRLKTGQRANGSGLDPAVEGAVILGPAAPSLRPRRRGPRWCPCRWPRPGAPSRAAGLPHRAPARRQGLRADTGSCRGAVARPGYAPTPAQPCAEGIQDLLAPPTASRCAQELPYGRSRRLRHRGLPRQARRTRRASSSAGPPRPCVPGPQRWQPLLGDTDTEPRPSHCRSCPGSGLAARHRSNCAADAATPSAARRSSSRWRRASPGASQPPLPLAASCALPPGMPTVHKAESIRRAYPGKTTHLSPTKSPPQTVTSETSPSP